MKSTYHLEKIAESSSASFFGINLKSWNYYTHTSKSFDFFPERLGVKIAAMNFRKLYNYVKGLGHYVKNPALE